MNTNKGVEKKNMQVLPRLCALGTAKVATITLLFAFGALRPDALLTAQIASPANFGNQARDPGVRGGPSGAGGPISGLTPQQLALFQEFQATFAEVDSVSGNVSGEPGSGLGPGFNMNSCAGCHSFPASGGSSPQINPQVAVATLHGAHNTVPSFITLNGPVREARFKLKSDGTPDGGVHDLFVSTGRYDAPTGCNIQQTDFASQLSKGNVIFRIPTPTFGAGLIQAIPDATILANKSANSWQKSGYGISGRENRTGNDGSITRFGWKGQNKSLLIFSGEAYNVEQGVTNDAFPNPRETATGCDAQGHPEDHADFTSGEAGDVFEFALFMQMLAPPAPVSSYGNASSFSIQRGHGQFTSVGCVYCHTESLTTGPASIAALSNKQASLFSDLLLHHMGSGLSDGISQGVAGADEFRTAPLWGLGQRIFLLHDGRTTDLINAIQAHSSTGSEARSSVNAFNSLSDFSQQDLLNFLRSL
jgi:CxxC motif-containing protein (DUF1111 family)